MYSKADIKKLIHEVLDERKDLGEMKSGIAYLVNRLEGMPSATEADLTPDLSLDNQPSEEAESHYAPVTQNTGRQISIPLEVSISVRSLDANQA